MDQFTGLPRSDHRQVAIEHGPHDEAVAREIRGRYPRVTVTVGYPMSSLDLLINATSLGLKPADPLPFDEKKFSVSHRGQAVLAMLRDLKVVT